MTSYFRTLYDNALFRPSFISMMVNPFYFARKGLYQSTQSLSGKISGKVLDVGCGQKPYKHLFTYSEYVGLEIDSPHNRNQKQADYFYDGKSFPFEDDSFTSIICNQVLEHVFEPDDFLKEISRCLQPGGYLLITVPFLWDEHEIPYDFARYSSFGLKYLLEKEKFEIVAQKKSVNDIRVVFQMLSAYVFKVFMQERSRFQKVLVTALFIFPINILGECIGHILPKDKDLYLDNIICAQKND